MLEETCEKEKIIEDYLQKINLKSSSTTRNFWEKLYSKHNFSVVKELESVVTERALADKTSSLDIYEIKNKNLELSIDFASYSQDLYKKYFEWFANVKDAPRTILDIGCDNGIVTCFYAFLNPQAEIVGIDQSLYGIECAKKLAKKLELSNVKFIAGEFCNIKNIYPNNYFDYITSIRTFHEIIVIPEIRYWAADELEIVIKDDDSSLLLLVRDLLKDEQSKFISFERLPALGEYSWWIEIMRNAGLYVLWEEKQELQFHELGEIQTMPLFVASKTYQKKILQQDIINFYLGEVCLNLNNKEFNDLEGEAAFINIKDKELISGVQINYSDGAGDFRMEIWHSASGLLLYQYSNVGYRKLTILPNNYLDIAQAQLKTASVMDGSDNKIHCYKSILERDNFVTNNYS